MKWSDLNTSVPFHIFTITGYEFVEDIPNREIKSSIKNLELTKLLFNFNRYTKVVILVKQYREIICGL